MSHQRLDRFDAKVLLIWILAGLLGAGVAYKYFFQAFPEASVEFKVGRVEALQKAKSFAEVLGDTLAGYDSSIVFDVDDTAKTYLEREVGLDRANRTMANDVHIWYWETRFFRPLQKEEFDVRVSPAGGIVGYTHVLEETAPGARLDRAAAQSVAEMFLSNSLSSDLAQYEFREEEANSTERPNRRDWSFSWERRGFRAKDAPYRLRVTLAGDRVSGYDEFLKVPEAWKLEFDRLRSSNNLYEFIALLPYAFFVGGCLYVIISLGRRGLLDWRLGLTLGIFLTALYFIMTMNQWPLDRASYDTNTPYSSFFLSKMGQAALTSIVSALLVVIAVVPGEPLYRVSQPDRIRLDVGLRIPGIRTKDFFFANVIGICLAAAHIGYITIFYIVSRKLGAWAPQDLNYENVVSTSLPWIYPLAIGIYAATSEEFLFRLFAVPYMMRLTRSKFLAVVVPAFAWGFLHSNYPQEPAYIRGIEVGLIGIVAGLVMLRWGIWATLIWHYTVDAFLISTSLLRSHGVYLRLSGAIVGGGALIPLAIAGFFYLTRGGFDANPELLNRARPLGGVPLPNDIAVDDVSPDANVESSPTSTVVQYAKMSSRTLAALIACGLLGLALLVGVKREAIGDFVRFQIDSGEAVALGNKALLEMRSDSNPESKIDLKTYRHAATLTYTFDGYVNEYLRRTVGIAAANRIYRDRVPSAFWTIRYFRDSQNEEYMVVLRPDGTLHSIHHTLDEKTPGTNLTRVEAQARAENYLREQKKVDLSGWNLVDAQTEKRPSRTDHAFEWEQKNSLEAAAGEGGAHIRMQLHVQGEEVSGYRIFIKIPEAWRDAESRTTGAQLAQTFARVILVLVIFVGVLVIFLRSLKHPVFLSIPWRRLLTWSLWMLAAAVVLFLNRIPELMSNYTTTTPLAMYYATLAISMIFAVALYLAGAVLILGIGWFFLKRAFGDVSIPGWTGMNAAYYRDAFCVTLFGSIAIMGLNRVPSLLARWPVLRHSLGSSVPEGLDLINPTIGAAANGIAASFIVAGVIGLAAGAIALYIRPIWMRAGLVILYAILVTTNVATPGAFVSDMAFHLLFGIAIWFGVTHIVRWNVAGYFLLAAVITLVPRSLELIEQPNIFFHVNGYAVMACTLALLAWPLVQWQRRAQML